MGYLVAMVIRVMLFVLVKFVILYTVQVKSMCVPILRSIGSELTKLENMQQLAGTPPDWRYCQINSIIIDYREQSVLIEWVVWV